MTTAPQTNAGGGGAEEFDWLTLDEGEEVLWSGEPHFYSIVPALVVGVPLTLVLIGIPIILASYFSRENTVYLLTSEGVYLKKGILSRDVQKIEFEKIQNISFSQGPLGNVAGYGNVDISTAGGSGVEMRFRAVSDPKSVQEQINTQIRRSRSGPRSGEESAGRDTDDVLEEILSELRTIRTALENGQEPARIEAEQGDSIDDHENRE